MSTPAARFIISLGVKEQYARYRFKTAFVLFFLILILGNIPGARENVGQYASGGVLHASAYSVIAYLLFSGYKGAGFERTVAAVLIVAGMGALDEYLQSFFPYRGASAGDWLVDVLSSIGTSALLCACYPRISGIDADDADLRGGPSR